MRHRFQTFWQGPSLTAYERMALASFVRHGHAVELYSYRDDLEVPPGVVLRDASEIVPRDEMTPFDGHDSQRGVLAFSDLFRFRLLAGRGGWWVDTDVVCTSPAPPEGEVFFAREREEGEDRKIGTAVLRFPAGHHLAVACAERCTEMHRRARAGRLGAAELAFASFGPKLIDGLVRELGCEALAVPAATCYPVHWSEFCDLFDASRTEELRRRCASAAFVHLWNEVFAKFNFSKDASLPPGSLIAELFATTGSAPPAGGRGEQDLGLQAGLVQRLWKSEAAVPWLTDELARVRRDRDRLAEEVGRFEAEVLRQQGIVASVLESRSWRITAPLRALFERGRGSR